MIAYNGKRSWLETHHEVVTRMTLADLRCDPRLEDIICTADVGMTIMYDIADELTDTFESRNFERQWDGEFFEEVEEFVEDFLNGEIRLTCLSGK